MNRRILIFIGFCLISVSAQSQSIERSVTAASGNYFYQAGTGSISFTAGENAVNTLVAPNNILTQGFQQPDTSTIIFVQENPFSFSIEIFPNPVFDFLSFKGETNSSFVFSFYDDAGRLISVPRQNNELQIVFDVSNLAEGIYILSVVDTGRKTVATKKFIKQ
jgi:hypothetical protein